MKSIILFMFVLFFCTTSCAQKTLSELPYLEMYAESNKQLGLPKEGEKRVVFIGNSITFAWVNQRPDFFSNNNYIGRGIGGQTSGQLLLRFQQDVVSLQPVAVLINIGTNDIAENTGDYNPNFTFANIKSMSEIAKANNIKVILSSVLPVGEYKWKKSIKNVPATIEALNKKIKEYADTNGFGYVDYHTPMKTEEGALKTEYGEDGVHPIQKGYEVMEVIAKKVIDEVVE